MAEARTVREAIAEVLRPFGGVPPTKEVRQAISTSTHEVLRRAGIDDVLPIAVRTEHGDAVFLLLVSAETAEPLAVQKVFEVLSKPVPTGGSN